MSGLKITLLVVEAVLGILIITFILMQPSKADALSGLIQGKTETFYSKNKSRTKESMLVKLTVVSAILFAVNTLALNLVK